MATTSEALAKALALHQAGKLMEAEAIYRQILLAEPNQADALHLLGELTYRLGKPELALEYIQKAIELNGNAAAFHNNLGEVFRSLHRYSEAIRCYQRALELNPNSAKAYSNLGNALGDFGNVDEAIACFRRALQLNSEFAEAYSNLGIALGGQGKFRAAMVSFQRAIALNPNLAEAHNNMGAEWKKQQNLEKAVACYCRALELNPKYAEAHNNLGLALADVGRLHEATICYQRAIDSNPNYAEAFTNLGIAFYEQGKIDEAIACHQRAIELRPTYAQAHNNLGNAWKTLGQLTEAAKCYRQAFELQPEAYISSNYLMSRVYDSMVPLDMIYSEHVRWAEQFAPAAMVSRVHSNSRDPDRRLRIGYISGDFTSHAVASFMEPVLRCHDREKFEVFCYANNVLIDDGTRRQKPLADYWRWSAGASDEILIQGIRDDQIDILVDLSGHSARNRLTALAHKPAPVQVTYIGYPATTGMAAIDYRFTDDVLNPSNEPSHHVEQLYRLPMGSACFVPRAECPDVGELPAKKRGFLTFGAPHHLAKLNTNVFDVWAKIFQTIPNARLVFFRDTLHGRVEEMIRQELSGRGIGTERIDVQCISTPTHGYDGYMAKYSDIDICLDAFPANAGATACESLWMGVPWLTLYGDRFFGRMTASVLTRLGLTPWISHNAEEMISKAKYWSEHLDQLASLRQGMRSRFAFSTVGDPVRYTRGLEAAYRDIWGRWCEQKKVVS